MCQKGMKKITKEIEQKIIELYLQNLKVKEIAKLTGVHESTVNTVRKRNNLSFKEKGIISITEKDKIIDLYQSGKSITQISKMYNCSQFVISSRLKKWNIELRQNNIDKYYTQAIELFKQGYSVTKIGKLFNLDRNSFSKRLQKDGMEVKNLWNECKFNEHVFDSIDTEEKAYWLGFIFADGYIASHTKESKPCYSFEISLKGDDIDHLYKFQKFVECKIDKVKTSTIKCNEKTHSRCRICLTNKHFWETLNSYGCTPCKSLSLKFPDVKIFKSKDLIRHFIRGYVDGDGSLGMYNRPEFSCLGTPEFLTAMLTYLESRHLFVNHGSTKTMVFAFSGTKAVAYLYHLYYKSNIYLERKFQIFNKIKDCRFKVKALKLLEDKIREGWDANPELIADLNDLQQCNA